MHYESSTFFGLYYIDAVDEEFSIVQYVRTRYIFFLHVTNRTNHLSIFSIRSIYLCSTRPRHRDETSGTFLPRDHGHGCPQRTRHTRGENTRR